MASNSPGSCRSFFHRFVDEERVDAAAVVDGRLRLRRGNFLAGTASEPRASCDELGLVGVDESATEDEGGWYLAVPTDPSR